ncbi:MAG TPA: carbohydrate kinase [Saprospiraceae bacterium]|nr:carbohydrate kinase [Saprospiraceae bacterium]HPI06045.1 carbohydrate kinase [Saprospiraceae bacterium]
MSNPAIICFGEILWDVLPTGRKAGGAPMNVAFHANQLGLESKMISKTGDDDLGKELKRFLENIGVSVELIQTDNTFPTGIVNVALDKNGSPSYEIVSPVAWDYIHPDDKVKDFVKNAGALIFGSLACRTERNKRTLLEYVDLANIRVFDVNLRTPFYSKPLVEEFLGKADIVKMNDEELTLIGEWLGISGTEKAQLEYIKNEFSLDLVILTKGRHGAACLDETGYYEQPGFRVNVQDTIGSGDSFLAAFLSRFLKGESTRDCLVFASAVGALVATKQGGTPKIDLPEILAIMNSKSFQQT